MSAATFWSAMRGRVAVIRFLFPSLPLSRFLRDGGYKQRECFLRGNFIEVAMEILSSARNALFSLGILKSSRGELNALINSPSNRSMAFTVSAANPASRRGFSENLPGLCVPGFRPVFNSKPRLGVLLSRFSYKFEWPSRDSQSLLCRSVTRFFVVERQTKPAEVDRSVYAQYGVNCTSCIASFHG